MKPIRLKTFCRFLLAGLQVFISFTALIGGAKLVSDPSGNAVGIPLEWLNGSPFPDYSIPGWVLVIVIGFGNGVASLLSALGYRQYGRVAIVQGGLLIAYIGVEVWSVGLRVMLQPLYFMFGLVQIFLGFLAQRKAEMRCEKVSNLSDTATASPECASEPRR